MVAGGAGWCHQGYAPEPVFVSAPLEDGRPFAGDGDVVVVMDRGAFLPLMEYGDVPVVSESSDTE